MQTAAIPGYRISRAKLSTKILTTLGLLGLFLGLFFSAVLTASKSGISPSAVQTYYLGSVPKDSEATNSSESSLEDVLTISTPRPLAELAEVTHLHLLGGSMLLFFLCHLLSVCQISETTRTSLYCASFFCFLSTFSLPWLIVYLSPVFALFYGPSVLGLIFCLGLLTVIPIYEMWFLKSGG